MTISQANAAVLQGLGFETADTTIHKRIILSVEGLEKQGKTHFALGAPGPVLLFNMDVGLEGVISKFPDKEIKVYNLPMPQLNTQTTQTEAEQQWNKFVDVWERILGIKDVRTIVVDTATELWDLARVAYFGKISQVKPHHYVHINSEFRRVIRMPLDKSDKNVIFLHQMKKKYVNKGDKADSVWDGTYERSGFNNTGYLVQGMCRVRRIYKRDMEAKGYDVTPPFSVEILESRHNPMVVGEVFEGPMATFPFVACQIIEGTSPDDWS